LIKEAIKRNDVTLIEEDNLEANINKRMELFEKYRKGREIACYVNIGGGLASLGGTQNAKLIPPGLSMHLAMKNFPVRGVINRMAEEGIPVIHLLNVEKIAERYGLPAIVGDKAPELGQGELFFRDRYSVNSTLVLTLILGVVLFVFIRIDVKHYLFRRSSVPKIKSAVGGEDELI